MLKIKLSISLILLSHFFMAVSFGMVNPALGYYAQKFGANISDIGYLFAINAGMGIVLSPLLGIVARKIGIEVIISMIFIISAISLFGSYYSSSFIELFLWRMLGGVHAACIPLLIAWLSCFVASSKKGIIASWIQGLIPVGFVAGPLISSTLSNFSTLSGLKTIFFLSSLSSTAAAIGLALGSYLLFKIQNSSSLGLSTNNSYKFSFSTLFSIFSNKTLTPVTISLLCIFVYTGLFSSLYKVAEIVASNQGNYVGFLYSTFSLTYALAQLVFFPFLSGKISSRLLIYISGAFIVFGCLLQVIPLPNFYIFICLPLISLGAGMAVSACTEWILKMLNENSKIEFFSILGFFNGAAKFTSPIIFGYGIEHFNPRILFFMILALMVFTLTASITRFFMENKSYPFTN